MKITTSFYGINKYKDKFGTETEINEFDEKTDFMSIFKQFWKSRQDDILLFNIDHRRLFLFCLLRKFIAHKALFISVDILLRKPTTRKERITAKIKTLLLKKIDYFILYFKDTKLYQEYFGIDKSKIRFVHFKVNLWHYLKDLPRNDKPGEYILLAGRGLRDYETFIKAVMEIPYSAKIMYESKEILQQHGTHFPDMKLPDNLSLYQHDGRTETWAEAIAGARIVVIPRYKYDIGNTGMSTYHDAMILNRCTILGHGIGTSDLLKDEAALVEPGNVKKLAETIELLWNNDTKRTQYANSGYSYAKDILQGEERFYTDIVHVCHDLCHKVTSEKHF